MDGPGVVESFASQEEAKLVAWRKAFYRIPHKPLLQGEPKTNVTRMQASTMFCSESFHASLTDYGRAVKRAKDRSLHAVHSRCR